MSHWKFYITCTPLFSVSPEDDKPVEGKESRPAQDSSKTNDAKKPEKPETSKTFGAISSAVMVS